MNAAPLFCFEDVCEWLQQATLEIFQSTFGLPAFAVPAPPASGISDPLIASSTSFSGAFEATLVLAAKNPSAVVLASRMLEIPESEVRPENTDDVMKELGNMILGAVKSRISDLGTECSMGIPQSAEWISTIAQEEPVSEEGQTRQRMKFSFGAGELLVDLVFSAAPPTKQPGNPPR
jgi:hypothetical protein